MVSVIKDLTAQLNPSQSGAIHSNPERLGRIWAANPSPDLPPHLQHELEQYRQYLISKKSMGAKDEAIAETKFNPSSPIHPLPQSETSDINTTSTKASN